MVLKWISVNDRLPEPGKYVLVVAGKNVMRAYHAPPKTFTNDYDADWGEYDEEKDVYWLPCGWYETNHCEETNWQIDCDPVTHWMPLPELPEVVK